MGERIMVLGLINCKICSSKIDWKYSQKTVDQMKDRRVCFKCNYWMNQVDNKDHPDFVRINGALYALGDEFLGRDIKGFEGREFLIQKDSRVIKTTNLLHHGRIPEIFKEQLPDNAEFVRKDTDKSEVGNCDRKI